MDIEQKLPNCDADGEINGDQIIVAEQVAAAWPGRAIRISEVIERIIARDNL